MRHWTAHHPSGPNAQVTLDPLNLPTLEGNSPQWPRMWDTADSTLRMAPGGHRLVWPGAKDPVTVARAAQVRHSTANDRECGACAVLSTAGTLLRVPRPGNLLSTVDKRWVAAMVLNRDMGPVMCLPSLGELPEAALGALSVPRTSLSMADVGHWTGCLMRGCGTPCCAWQRQRGECP